MVSTDAPPVVIGAKNWITPCAELEKEFFPQPEWMIDAIHSKLMPIPGYTATTNFTPGYRLDVEKKGH